jgi:glucose/arabinose dehydrogenase
MEVVMPNNCTDRALPVTGAARSSGRRAVVVAIAALALVATLGPEAGAAIRARRIARGFSFPTAFAFAPQGRIFVGEKATGRIRIYDRRTGNTHVFHRFRNVNASGERGVLGIALDPDYANNRFVYVYVTRSLSGGVRNQIVRLTNVGGKGRNRTVIYGAPSGATNHQGGRILFGPDGNLYAVVGDGGAPANAQDLDDPRGSVLRMTRNGGAVAGNARERIYAFGIRNSFGMAFDPKTGRLWETENGPECNDELNRIVRGGNFAWGPTQDCGSLVAPNDTNRDGPEPRILPRAWYVNTFAPTGIAFCVRCGIRGSGGKLFFGAANTGHVRRVRLTPNRLGVRSQRVVYDHPDSVISMEVDPRNRRIYFSDRTAIYRLIRT